MGGGWRLCEKKNPGDESRVYSRDTMSDLQILQNPEVAARTSAATRRVLEERANPQSYSPFLSEAHLGMLRSLVNSILPQDAVGTKVDLAEAIDRRLAAGENAGWRYAVLPPDGEAYRKGLEVFHTMLEQTPMKTFDRMPPPAREGYLRCVANGDVDGPAQFPLSVFLKMVRTDVARLWVSHPEAMRVMGYYGFADGPTGNEGWTAIGPNSAAPFEYEGAGEVAAVGTTPNATAVSGSMGDGSQDAPSAAGGGASPSADASRGGAR